MIKKLWNDTEHPILLPRRYLLNQVVMSHPLPEFILMSSV